MSRDKGTRIPSRFRRRLSRRRYRSIRRMLSSRTELSLLESVFSLGADGKYHYQSTLDRETVESVAALLKRVHRNGFHTFRIILLAVIICLPILFNIFFLDKLAARQLEIFLESLSKTDVTVEGLDIAPLMGQISLKHLGFASKSDPMVDTWQMQDAVADISWGALSFRRLIFKELRGTGVINAARHTSAVYPSTEAGPSEEGIRRFSGTDWMPDEVIPDETVKLVQSLKEDYETEYLAWASKVEEDIAFARSLGERVELLVTEAMPESVDDWIARVEEGRTVAVEISSVMTLLNGYKRDFDAAFTNAENAFERAGRAVEKDLASIEGSLNEASLNLWLQSVIDELVGPRFSDVYRQAAPALADLRSSRQRQEKGKKRMKQGRVVRFPVRLPPRFSIEILSIGGENVYISGENIGIDHDLAGAPSHFLIEFDELGSLDALAADITIDGRTGADNVFLGSVDFDDLDWLIDYEDSSGAKNSIGGLIGAKTTLSFVQTPEPSLKIAGLARLTDWKGLGGGGFFSLVQEYSPPLGFRFETQFSEKNADFKVSVLEEYIRNWVDLLSDTLLLEIREKALSRVGVDLEDFDAFLVDWSDKGEILNLTLEQLAAQSDYLKKNIAEWTEQTTGGLIPSPGLLEGLGSLF